jgi:hypothetical protein
MDFQGQGLALTGETEALAIIDSFTKVVTLIPLPDRQAHTLVPKLLDAIYFTRGSPDIIHSDDAPEFLSELLTSIAAITGTCRTTTCGHNPQSNGEIESWWRFWNRAMKFLSPSDYLHWPRFAQRICFAHNSVSHSTLGSLSPFEMDHGSPAQLPFAPPDPTIRIPRHDASPETSPSPTPAAFVAALQTSVQAFHRFAATHKTFLAKTTEERLNKHGTPAHFSVDDRVKIYVPPPTHKSYAPAADPITSSPGAVLVASRSSFRRRPMKSLRSVQVALFNAPLLICAPFAPPRTPRHRTTIFSPKPPSTQAPSSPSATPPALYFISPKYSRLTKTSSVSTTSEPPPRPLTLLPFVSSGLPPTKRPS